MPRKGRTAEEVAELAHRKGFNADTNRSIPRKGIKVQQSRCTTTHEPGKHPRTTFQSDRDKEPAYAREMYRQGKLAEHDERRKQLVSNPDHSTALDIKECVLEVKQLYSKQLAAEENQMKDVTKIPGALIIEFEKSQKEVEGFIEGLRSLGRTPVHHRDGL